MSIFDLYIYRNGRRGGGGLGDIINIALSFVVLSVALPSPLPRLALSLNASLLSFHLDCLRLTPSPSSSPTLAPTFLFLIVPSLPSLNPHSAYSLIAILPLHLSFSLLPLTPFTLPLLAFSLPPPPDALPSTFLPLLLLLLTLSFLSPLHFHSPPPDSLPLS